jgi:putative transposase
VKAHQAHHPVTLLCEVLGLSTSGYYAWAARGPSRRALRDAEITRLLCADHLASRGVYGSPRLQAVLRNRGENIARKRIARLMKAAGLSGVSRRPRHGTTQRDQQARPAPDLVDRQFRADGPNRLWVADITFIPTRSGAFYLAVVLDVWSRKIVGWATGTAMPAGLVIAALDMAVARRRPRNVIHHSDQGSQYTSLAFSARCAAHGVRVSMGSVADCYDNAMAESFFATLEAELLGLVPVFDGPADADPALFDWLEGCYNTRRLHSALGMRSPVDFERDELSAAVPSNPQDASPPGPPFLTGNSVQGREAQATT